MKMPKIVKISKDFMNEVALVVAFAAISVFVHFFNLGFPKEIIFDETTFGKFIVSYFKGEYYFDLHPPLGKLLFFGAAKLSGVFNPSFVYEAIGTPFTDDSFIWMRGVSALAGSFFPVLVYIMLRGLRYEKSTAILAGLLLILENGILSISRTFVFDVLILFFGFLCLASYVWYRRLQMRPLLFLSWLAAAAAFSTKWTGLSYAGLLLLLEFKKIYFDDPKQFDVSKIKRYLRQVLPGILLVFAFYFTVFQVHFALVPKSGIGNDFMSPEFQRDLVDSPYFDKAEISSLSTWKKFTELNAKMWSYQKGMVQPHPYASKWFTWPFMIRPIYFWVDQGKVLKKRIYLIGNPILWWLASLSILMYVYKTILRRKGWLRTALIVPIDTDPSRHFLLFCLFCLNFLPFILIGRVMFLYHYLTALCVSIIILAVIIDDIKYTWLKALLVMGIIAGFVLYLPLTYGWPLDQKNYELRLWLQSWM